jgi:ADP-heptose:LPS heptosyltransferase
MNEPTLVLEGPVRRIAIFRALFLGDLLCATPAFRAVRSRFPKAEITLIGLPWARELVDRLPSLDRLLPFAGYPGINEVPVDEARVAAFLDEARATQYDLAIQMHGSGEVSNGFVAALGARATLGYRHGPDHRLTLGLPWDCGAHETTRWTDLVACVGATTDALQLDLPIRPDEWAHADALLTDLASVSLPGFGPLVGLHVGAKDATRRWPAECFAALGDRLAARYGARIILTGSEPERALTAAVRRAMRAPALDLAGRTDLGTFAAIIGRLDLLVSNDTGASHIAAATGTRSVVLFGPSRPAQWAPLDRQRHVPIDALTAGRRAGVVPQMADPADALQRLPLGTVLDAAVEQLAVGGERWAISDSERLPAPSATAPLASAPLTDD